MLRLTVCPPSRFAASSNEAHVRVLGSKNRLAIVVPWSSSELIGLFPSGLR